MKQVALRSVMAICIITACIAAMTGCTTATQTTSDSSQSSVTAVQYLSNVNQLAAEIEECLAEFEDYVLEANVSAMRVSANKASELVDDLTNLEAPDSFAEVKSGYDEGFSALRDALSDYIQLYADITALESAIDTAEYEERLADIQEAYTKALQSISDTDELAASM